MKNRAIHLSIAAASLLSLLIGSSSMAATTVYNVVANGLGLDDGHACLSTVAAGSCAANATFTVPGTYAVTGTITVDDVALTADIDITLASGTMTGASGGVDEIEFTNVNYSVNNYPVFIAGGTTLFGTGTPTGAVGGVGATYEQLSGGGNVAGPDPITESTIFSALSCSSLDAIGLCGFTVGGSRDFAMPVAGTSTDFVHTFNFNVQAPEPSTAFLIPLGIATVAAMRRRNA